MFLCACDVAENGVFRGGERVNLVGVGVDPQLEGHSSGKLVPLVSEGNVVGVDLALDVDILIGSDVKELDGNQRLRVVHLRGTDPGTSLHTGANAFCLMHISLTDCRCITQTAQLLTAMFTKLGLVNLDLKGDLLCFFPLFFL